MELYALQPDFAASYLETIENATIEERAAAFSRFGDVSPVEIVTRSEDGTSATIAIKGMLTPSGPSPIARFFGFGGTGYNEIAAAAESLKADPGIDTVRLVMDTPGGTAAGMDSARQALKSLASEKTLIAENHGSVESAGYYLATAAPEIVAMSPLARTGSIGVVLAGLDFSDAMAREGIKRIKIVSRNAPNKQPDPTTAHGAGVWQEEIDATERVFIRKIAESRGVTDQAVIDKFGKGGTFIALDPDPDKPDALKAGMVDRVVTAGGAVVSDDSEEQETSVEIDAISGGPSGTPETQAAEGGGQSEGIRMDLNQLKAEHPALYQEAVNAGLALGVTQERERVEAHLTMGKASGAMDLATKCIADGSDLTAKVNAEYYAAGMDKTAVADRGNETEGDLETEETAASADKVLAKATAKALGVDTDA